MKTVLTSIAVHCVFVLTSPLTLNSCFGQTEIGLTAQLVEAAYHGNIDQVMKLVNDGADINGFHGGPHDGLVDENGSYPSDGQFWTPLKAAIAGEHTLIASYLIGAGARASNVHPDDKFGWSELHYLAFGNSKKQDKAALARLLLNAGANSKAKINHILCAYDAIYVGTTPLQLAGMRGNQQLVEVLRPPGEEETKQPVSTQTELPPELPFHP